MFRLIFALSFLLICLTFRLDAQFLDHVQGNAIVRISEDWNIHRVVEANQYFHGTPTGLQLKRTVSDYMDIYLLHFDFTKIHEDRFIEHLQRNTGVLVAQQNHLVSLRNTIPNDPEFPDQWQYINDGSNGGVVDADLDMELAWDLTTGGVTANGDTIVVCVIDNGLDPNHMDFEGNIWVNRGEIPDNGIDDDDNGFVDDYRGWNTGTDTDETSQANFHGTPVAGIIGARGNNGMGVAGVNWNVKLMIVVGGTGEEAEVLEAYSYPLSHRIKYNETNGEEGAFVVATNASWGVNFGQPDESPLWCAFYDTLGAAGILNAGATINADVNVDIEGDLPTGCSSEYLISVTNMNRSDVKVTAAGYGFETIDLGAFGEATWTAANNNSTGSFGGTSGATPHVTGAIALLYSAPCAAFANIAFNNPSVAAQLARQYILGGVDANLSLENITVTGGRLNINNSLQLLLNDCGSCPSPLNLQADSITDSFASLTWTLFDTSSQSNLRWRAMGDTVWIVDSIVRSPYPLTQLEVCSEYEFQIQAVCDTSSSAYSSSFVFRMDGCCVPPDDLAVEQITDSSATLSWSRVLAAQDYQVIYGDGFETDTLSSSGDDTIELTDLMSCTRYWAVFRSQCDTGFSVAGDTLSFLTFGCGICIEGDYCPSEGDDSSFEWIQSVQLNDFINDSGESDGYGFFPDFDIEFSQYEQIEATLTPGFSGNPFTEYWKIWIDYNQNGQFDLPEELVYDADGAADTVTTARFSISGDAKTGPTRMRITMKWIGGFDQEIPTACLTSFGFGEVEDYCITIVPGSPPCIAPDNLTADASSPGEALIDWDPVAGIDSFRVRWRVENEIEWEEDTVAATQYLLMGLLDCEPYLVRVQSLCAPDSLSASTEVPFLSNCPCDIPAFDTTFVGLDSIGIAWDNVDNANGYEIQYRATPDVIWMTDTVIGQNLYFLENLDECRIYEIRMRSICPGGESGFSSIAEINTDCESSVSLPGGPITHLTMRPNPVYNHLFLDLESQQGGIVTISIMDLRGVIFVQSQEFVASGSNTIHLEKLAALSRGVYLIRIQLEGQQGLMKFVKQ